MREPQLVADLLAAMREAAGGVQVTVKHRIGVDEQDPRESLFGFVETVAAAGVKTFIVHARKAWLQGLSPRENREVPPLDYEIVRTLKASRPDLTIILNGGLETITQAQAEAAGLDGVMLGRAAYQRPALLLDVDPMLFGEAAPHASAEAAVRAHADTIARGLAAGTPLHAMTRHMLGLFHGRPGGRAWRRILTVEGVKKGAGLAVLDAALAAVAEAGRRMELRDEPQDTQGEGADVALRALLQPQE
jgi:tRNA-dihydrouridine synthase A